jgi:hypothetical protein
MKINVNIRFFLLGCLFVLVSVFEDKYMFSAFLFVLPVTFLGGWALFGLLKSFPELSTKDKAIENSGIVLIFIKKILNIFTAFILAIISIAVPYFVYLLFTSY